VENPASQYYSGDPETGQAAALAITGPFYREAGSYPILGCANVLLSTHILARGSKECGKSQFALVP
jgi:hypothetical protein